MVVLERQLVPPPGETPGFEQDETLVYDEGFSLDKLLASISVPCEYPKDVHIGVDAEGRKRSPIEIKTGMPIPIVSNRLGIVLNSHHSFYYKKLFLSGSIGQQATRYSRLQEVRVKTHDAHHKNGVYDGGVVLPVKESDQFRLTVLNLAGYITPFGIRPKNEEVVELSPRQRGSLRQPGIFTFEHRDTIVKFLMHYVLGQDCVFGDEVLIEKFLSTGSDIVQDDAKAKKRRHEAGIQLVKQAIPCAVVPINKIYNEARAERLLRLRTKPVGSAEEEVRRFVSGHEKRYFDLLEEKLRDRYLGETALAA